jgi:hypothetical protein
MNKQNVFNIPDEDKIGELLGKIQPMPSRDFHKSMEQANWQTKNVLMKTAVIKPRLKYTIAAFVILTVILLGATPQGRAWAQDAFQFFKQVDVTTIPLSDEELKWFNAPTEYYDLPLVPVVIPTPLPEMTLLPGCETAEKTQSYSCKRRSTTCTSAPGWHRSS